LLAGELQTSYNGFYVLFTNFFWSKFQALKADGSELPHQVEFQSSIEMKVFAFLTIFACISLVISAQSTAFSTCPSDIPKKEPTALKPQTIYQLVKAKNNDEAKCIKLNFAAAGKTLQITQYLTYGGVVLDHVYFATATVNGTFEVKMNSE
jgi:hypothetical protein